MEKLPSLGCSCREGRSQSGNPAGPQNKRRIGKIGFCCKLRLSRGLHDSILRSSVSLQSRVVINYRWSSCLESPRTRSMGIISPRAEDSPRCTWTLKFRRQVGGFVKSWLYNVVRYPANVIVAFYVANNSLLHGDYGYMIVLLPLSRRILLQVSLLRSKLFDQAVVRLLENQCSSIVGRKNEPKR